MRRLLFLAALAAFITTTAQAETPLDRATRNYEMLMKGQKRVSDLSESERAELAKLEQLARNLPEDSRSSTERCRAGEIKRAGGAPSALELRIIGLKCSQR